jgi:hypothetical protein
LPGAAELFFEQSAQREVEFLAARSSAASKESRGSRPGFANSWRMSFSIGSPALSDTNRFGSIF